MINAITVLLMYSANIAIDRTRKIILRCYLYNVYIQVTKFTKSHMSSK